MEMRFKNTQERFEFNKEEEEKTLQKLNSLCDELEKKKEVELDNTIKHKLNNFIKETEKEIEYCELIIQELNQSIDFCEGRE